MTSSSAMARVFHAIFVALLLERTSGLHSRRIGCRVGDARCQTVPNVIYTTYPHGVDGSIWRRNVQTFASGLKVAMYSDVQMGESVCEIDTMLVEVGIMGAKEAFANLRPGAYKADLWRYMILWAYGGVYLDESVRLTANISNWVDFTSARLMLVEDLGGIGYWNAMMAAPPRHTGVEFAIRQSILNIQWHFYGQTSLDVTGPHMLFVALAQLPDLETLIDVSWRLHAEDNCGDPCEVHVIRKDPQVEAVVVTLAEKTSDDRRVFAGPEHYPQLWNTRCVYCDDIGTSCDVAKPCVPLPEDCA